MCQILEVLLLLPQVFQGGNFYQSRRTVRLLLLEVFSWRSSPVALRGHLLSLFLSCERVVRGPTYSYVYEHAAVI